MKKKNHVGRPTNEEVKIKKLKKSLIIVLPIVFVSIIAMLIYTEGNMSKLMGNSVDINSTGGLLNKTYTLKFNSVVGSGNMPNQIVTMGSHTKVNKNTFNPPSSNTTFLGWAVYNSKNQVLSVIYGTYLFEWLSNYQYLIDGDAKKTVDGAYLIKDGADLTKLQEKLESDKASGAKLNVGETYTLKAIWDGPLTISFNSNGGTGYMKSINARLSWSEITWLNLPRLEYTKNGYKFVGWSVYYNDINKWYCGGQAKKKEECSNITKFQYDIGEVPTTYTSSKITLYANWEPIKNGVDNFTALYNSSPTVGKGNTISSQTVKYGVKTYLQQPSKLVNSGYRLKGWKAVVSYGPRAGKWLCYNDGSKRVIKWLDTSVCNSFGYVVVTKTDNVGELIEPGNTLILYPVWEKIVVINSTVTYSCPSGYTKVGDGPNTKCSKTTTTNATSKIKSYSCAPVNNVTKQGNKCYHRYGVTKSYSCPSGYTKVGDGPSTTCEKTENPVSKKTTYCSGSSYWIIRNGKCSYQKSATQSCPSGYKKNGSNCEYTYKATVKNRRYTCPNGGKINGSSQCVKTVSISYTCPKFQDIRGNLSGRTCYYTKSTTTGTTKVCNRGKMYYSKCLVETKPNVTSSCAKGYTLSGSNCYKITDASPYYEYSCPSGYTKTGSGSNTKCKKTTTVTPIKTYTCPSGYTKTGSGSNTKCEK